jgi:hypothetical protein
MEKQPKFKVGDIVEVFRDDYGISGFGDVSTRKGTTGKIEDICAWEKGFVAINNSNYWVDEKNLRLIESAEEPSKDFKVCDWVRLISKTGKFKSDICYDYAFMKADNIGEIGTIYGFERAGDIKVVFNNEVGGHNSFGPDGYCQTVSIEDIELVEEEKKREFEFKPFIVDDLEIDSDWDQPIERFTRAMRMSYPILPQPNPWVTASASATSASVRDLTSAFSFDISLYDDSFNPDSFLPSISEPVKPKPNKLLKKLFRRKYMNKTISNLFENTKDALLVEKHLESAIGNNPLNEILFASHKDAILNKAKEMEAEEKENKE